jgi:hypothetical protein
MFPTSILQEASQLRRHSNVTFYNVDLKSKYEPIVRSIY